MRVGLVIYGSLETVSGGFLYDRMLVEALRRAADTVDIFSLPWKGYAGCLAQNLDRGFRASLLSWPGDILLEDELNHPSLALHNRALRRRGRFPLVSIVHHLRSSERRPRALYRQVERGYLRSVDGFLFNSEITRRAVGDLLGGPVSGAVATPGGDRLGPGSSEAEILERCSRRDPLRILFAGNIIPRKGLLTLLQALASLAPEGWSLMIAGSETADPGHASAVRRFVSARSIGGRVRFAGHLDDRDLTAALRGAHLLAVPSQYEGFGIVYLEAMAFGVVPIGSSAGGASEIIESGVSGLLVAPGDAGGLAEAIGSLVADRARLSDLALGARRRFDSFPSWERSMAAAVGYLHAIAHGKGN